MTLIVYRISRPMSNNRKEDFKALNLNLQLINLSLYSRDLDL